MIIHYTLYYTSEQEAFVKEFIERDLGEIYCSFPCMVEMNTVTYSTVTRSEKTDLSIYLLNMVKSDLIRSFTCKKAERVQSVLLS